MKFLRWLSLIGSTAQRCVYNPHRSGLWAGGFDHCFNCGDRTGGPRFCGCSRPLHGSVYCANCGGFVSQEAVTAA